MRPWEINTKFVVFFPQSLKLKSIVHCILDFGAAVTVTEIV